MDEEGLQVEGLDIAVGWDGYDPTAWREHPDPGGDEFEDDDDGPWPPELADALGFDPKEIL